LHSLERLITVLERAPLAAYSGFSYRVIADRWRDSPLSAIGSFERGGRYNAPRTFPVLYSADSQMTALLETEALFITTDGQLRGAPRDPDLILTLECTLLRVLDLTARTSMPISACLVNLSALFRRASSCSVNFLSA